MVQRGRPRKYPTDEGVALSAPLQVATEIKYADPVLMLHKSGINSGPINVQPGSIAAFEAEGWYIIEEGKK